MRFSHLINLICVALIAGHIGGRIQKNRDINEVEEGLNHLIKEVKDSHKTNIVYAPQMIFNTRSDAEEVLDQIRDLMNDYNMMTVADFYELVGQTSSLSDNRFGWTDLKNVHIKRTPAGYLLTLPQPRLLH